MKYLKNEGMSLLEMSLAMGLSALVVLGATQLSKSQNTEHASNRLNVGEELDVIAKLMNNRGICTDTLNSLAIGSNVPSIKKGNKILYNNGQKLNKAKLASMSLESSSTWSPVANEYGPVTLKLNVEKDNKITTKFYPLGVQLDAAGRVVSCYPNVDLADINDDIYREVCRDVVKGSMSGTTCNWQKLTQYQYVYIPAPVAPPAANGEYCIGPICDMYLMVLGRYPDHGGKAFWEEDWSKHGGAYVLENIKKSKEAKGEQWTQAELDYYAKDVAERGMSLGEAQKLCGVDKTC